MTEPTTPEATTTPAVEPTSKAPKAPKPAKAAEAKAEKPRPEVFVAIDAFVYKGTVLVARGDTIEAGHPMLKGRENLFRPFEPTFRVTG